MSSYTFFLQVLERFDLLQPLLKERNSLHKDMNFVLFNNSNSFSKEHLIRYKLFKEVCRKFQAPLSNYFHKERHCGNGKIVGSSVKNLLK